MFLKLSEAINKYTEYYVHISRGDKPKTEKEGNDTSKDNTTSPPYVSNEIEIESG